MEQELEAVVHKLAEARWPWRIHATYDESIGRFLDEIGEIALDLQAKLLRVVQDGEIERIGEERTRKIDVRIIAAKEESLFDNIPGCSMGLKTTSRRFFAREAVRRRESAAHQPEGAWICRIIPEHWNRAPQVSGDGIRKFSGPLKRGHPPTQSAIP